MIAAARKRLPQLHFELDRSRRWIAVDASAVALDPSILANAVLHWVPDHAALFPALIARLAPRGTLAVQMPDNLDEPAQRSMREVAEAVPGAASSLPLRPARAHRERRMVLHLAALELCRRRHLADHVLSRAAGRRTCNRGVVQGQRPAAVPRAARRGRARSVPRALYRGGEERLSVARRTAPCCCRFPGCSSLPLARHESRVRGFASGRLARWRGALVGAREPPASIAGVI